jgi:PAS domain S-box-containing protein
MITALNDKQSIDRCFDAGATDYLTKPINNQVLRRRVRRMVRTRQAEEGLRANEARLSSIIHTATDAIVLTDGERRISLFNAAAERMFGWQAAEIAGGGLEQLISASTDEACADLVRRGRPIPVTAAGDYLQGNGRRRDGSEFPIEISLGHFEQNGQQMLTITIRDITRRKQAEAEIERRVQQLASLAQIGQVVTTRLELHEVLQTVIDQVMARLEAEGVSTLLLDNPEELVFAAVNGASADKLRGVHIPVNAGVAGEVMRTGRAVRIRSKEDLARIYRDVETISQYHAQDIVAVPLKLGDEMLGVMEAVHSKAHVFTDDDLYLLESAGSWAAIAIGNARLYQSEHTQRVMAEALRDTAAAIIGSIDLDDVLDRLLDNVGRVMPHDAANIMLVESGVARVVRWRGYDRAVSDQLRARRYSVVDTQPLRQMAESHQPVAISQIGDQSEWITLPGSRAVQSFIGAPIRFKRKLLGFINLESETVGFFKAEYADRLQVFANQAATALENARLYQLEQEETQRVQQLQAAAMQSEKTEALGRLAASLARAMEKPLRTMHDEVQQAAASAQDPAQYQQHLQNVGSEIERLENITRSVLSFTRPETEERRETQVHDLIQQAMQQARPLFDQYRIQVTTDLAPVPPVLVAPRQVTQVLFYLLENAVEASGKRGQVHIVTQVADQHVLAMVIDDGPSISPEDRPHIFDPFYTTKQHGTGLGLAISHSVVQQQGGSLTAENVTNDRGVMFVVKLPAAPRH